MYVCVCIVCHSGGFTLSFKGHSGGQFTAATVSPPSTRGRAGCGGQLHAAIPAPALSPLGLLAASLLHIVLLSAEPLLKLASAKKQNSPRKLESGKHSD